MKIMYQASAVSTGGRDGKVIVEDSPLEFDMALPPRTWRDEKKRGKPRTIVRKPVIPSASAAQCSM